MLSLVMLQRSVKGIELLGNAVGIYREVRDKDVSGKQIKMQFPDSAREPMGEHCSLKYIYLFIL